MHRRAIVDERVELLSTGDFLRALEGARLIQSTDRILDAAVAAGRNMERQRVASAEPARAALLEQLRKIEESSAQHDAKRAIDPDPTKGRDR